MFGIRVPSALSSPKKHALHAAWECRWQYSRVLWQEAGQAYPQLASVKSIIRLYPGSGYFDLLCLSENGRGGWKSLQVKTFAER